MSPGSTQSSGSLIERLRGAVCYASTNKEWPNKLLEEAADELEAAEYRETYLRKKTRRIVCQRLTRGYLARHLSRVPEGRKPMSRCWHFWRQQWMSIYGICCRPCMSRRASEYCDVIHHEGFTEYRENLNAPGWKESDRDRA